MLADLAKRRLAEAMRAYEPLLTDLRRMLGQDAPHTLTARYNLAGLLGESGQAPEVPGVPQTGRPTGTRRGCADVARTWSRRSVAGWPSDERR